MTSSIAPSTWVLALLALGSVALVHADPWTGAAQEAAIHRRVSGTTGRLWPELPEGVPTDLRLEIHPADGPAVRIAPDRRGFGVWAGQTLVGPADPEALDGLWGSLGAAVTLRAVPSDAPVGLGRGGRIRITYAEQDHELVLGGPSPDGVGVYGKVEPGDGSVWVVEPQLADLTRQQAQAWAARRPLVLSLAEVRGLEFADASLTRGPDGLWRSRVGDTTAILSTQAVEARTARLFSARLAPWGQVPPSTEGEPWLKVRTLDAEAVPLWLRGVCPGHPDSMLVDRGFGWTGCIDARLTAPWPLPGRGGASGLAWVEPRLIPYVYGRVLAIEQQLPEPRQLRRRGGGWVVEARVAGTLEVQEVMEPEVYRWFAALHDARLRPDPAPALVEPEIDWLLHTDAAVDLRLRCGPDHHGLRVCRRDDGPTFTVQIPVDLAFGTDQFSDRRLADLDPGEARGLEILGDDGTVRQGAHLDLGVWRLDAPLHPEGDGALDEERVEALLAVLSGARIKSWAERPAGPPVRTIRVDRVPAQGRTEPLQLVLWPDCRVQVGTARPAVVSEATCAALGEDLLDAGALQRVVEGARALVVEWQGQRVRLRRDDQALVREDAEPLAELGDRLRRWAQLRAVALRAGDPPGPPVARWEVTPRAGEPYSMELGPGWAKIGGQDWYYALAAPREGPERVGQVE